MVPLPNAMRLKAEVTVCGEWVMGFIYRKSLNLGPFRVNLSKAGVGLSLGRKSFRAGISSQGRTYTSVGVPGTGMSYRTSGTLKSGRSWLQKLNELFLFAGVVMEGMTW